MFVGLDVHARSWTAAVRVAGVQVKRWQGPSACEVLLSTLRRQFPGATYRLVYEAGCCGFWIARRFAELGQRCEIVNPADVASTDKERRRKDDPRDASKLARELEDGNLIPIYIPSPAIERLRQLCRARERLVSHGTRLKLRIKGYLLQDGIVPPPQSELCHWTLPFLAWVDAQAERTNRPEALSLALEELRDQRPRLVRATRMLRATVRADEEFAEIVHLLRTVPGVGFVTAVTLLTEIADIHRFSCFDKLCSFAGLICDRHASGDRSRQTGLTKRHNRYLRHLLVEAAWIAIRRDPQLLLTYTRASLRMKHSRAILVVARRLLSHLRAVWRDQRPYHDEPIDESNGN